MAQYIYGKNMVLERLRSNKPIQKMVLLKDQNDAEVLSYAKKNKIPTEFVDRKKLDTLASGGKHQGVLCIIDDYKTLELNDLLKTIKPNKLPLLVMLDQLEDPHNLGAILRTSDAIGVDGIIIKKNNAVGLNATVAKVSTGAIETVPVAEVVNLSQTLESLKKLGYWVFGTDATDSVDYRLCKYDAPIVLVVGSEGKGISRLVKEHCDQMISLPMIGSVTSLNASVATAIILYQIYGQRYPIK